jgi:uncharacterized pyridoxamine 5'-phosphate oxidase family protein
LHLNFVNLALQVFAVTVGGDCFRKFLMCQPSKEHEVFALNFEECVKFANENPVAYLATVDEKGQPRVRALAMWYADETGFYFQSGTVKELVGQLKKNPKTEVCWFNNKTEGGIMLRVTGEVEFLDTPNMREKVVADRPFLKTMGITASSPGLVIFRIAKGEAYTWTWATNFEPKKMVKFGEKA